MNIWEKTYGESVDSETVREDMHIIRCMFTHVKDIRKTDETEDKAGIDYIVTLETSGRGCSNRGCEIAVDIKTRREGTAKHWKHGEPEITLEIISNAEKGKTGWTLDTSKKTDYVIYRFDEVPDIYMFPAQLLRIATEQNFSVWKNKYKYGQETSQDETGNTWHSMALFVPASVVRNAVNSVAFQIINIERQKH